MFKPRTIKSDPTWSDKDGIKIYTISLNSEDIDKSNFTARLAAVKNLKSVCWINTPAFVIFHEGERFLYLVLTWWGNNNELFTSVSVLTDQGWQEDPDKYSFCLYDLEVFMEERSIYIETMYSGQVNLEAYRRQRGQFF